MLHTFHIPVMGIGFTIDTPIKVARFGISSVVSIVEDHLMEQMREYYSEREGKEYIAIGTDDPDYRARRTTAYLNLMNDMVKKQFEKLVREPFEKGNDIVKYMEMLPDNAPVKALYDKMLCASESEKEKMQHQIRSQITAGSIDVNIMTKLDKNNYSKTGELLPPEYADAMSALRGFALSELSSSIVFSAGLNPRLYTYCETFPDFFPDLKGCIKKKIILKVSDYRSALIQGKFFAKKGLWVSEYRIESGLNCGGHAFATDGFLLGPVMEEFRMKREELAAEIREICNDALAKKGNKGFVVQPTPRVTIQGGIGTASENEFLLNYFNMDSTGWGSPFLLVPEATNVDDETLTQLITAQKEDYYRSDVSPLGVPFNNFRKSSSEIQKKERIEKGRPGSPCYKSFLAFNTEFTEKPICTASRQYQHLKIKQLEEKNTFPETFAKELESIVVKDCLCEGLSAPALLDKGITPAHGLTAVTICPGPNLAYFSNVFTLKEMADHIYGKINLLNSLRRPHMFINELNLYVDYLKNEIQKNLDSFSVRQDKYFSTFRNNLLTGIEYYKKLIPEMNMETEKCLSILESELTHFENLVANLSFPQVAAS